MGKENTFSLDITAAIFASSEEHPLNYNVEELVEHVVNEKGNTLLSTLKTSNTSSLDITPAIFASSEEDPLNYNLEEQVENVVNDEPKSLPVITLGSILRAKSKADPYMGATIFAPSEEHSLIYSVEELVENVVENNKPKFVAQCVLMDGYNAYRQVNALPPVEVEGWCHGLTLYWLKKRAQGKEAIFFENYNLIVGHRLDALDIDSDKAKALQKKIEKFYKNIMKGQSPWDYIPSAGQEDIAAILKTPDIRTWYDPTGEGYSLKKLQNILKEVMKKEEDIPRYDMIRISAASSNSHTVGMFIAADGSADVFDCNSKNELSVRHKQFSYLQAARWIKNVLYTNLNLPKKEQNRMKITITGIKSSSMLQNRIPAEAPAVNSINLVSRNRYYFSSHNISKKRKTCEKPDGSSQPIKENHKIPRNAYNANASSYKGQLFNKQIKSLQRLEAQVQALGTGLSKV